MRISPGQPTPDHWPRSPGPASASSASRREQEPPPPSPSIMCSFFGGTIEGILTSCLTVWYASCIASNRKTLQLVSPAKQPALWVTPATPHTASSASCHLGDGTAASGLAPPDWLTAFHQAVRKLNSLPSPYSEIFFTFFEFIYCKYYLFCFI